MWKNRNRKFSKLHSWRKCIQTSLFRRINSFICDPLSNGFLSIFWAFVSILCRYAIFAKNFIVWSTFFFLLCAQFQFRLMPNQADSRLSKKKTCLNRNWWNISSNIGTNDSSFSIRCAVKIFRYRKKTACKAKNSFEKKYQFFGKRLERIQWKIRSNNAL